MFRKDFIIKNLNEDLDKCFTPIRIIIKSNSLYDEFLRNDDDVFWENLKNYMIENIFSWNEIFPFGFKGDINLELGKTFSFLDSFQVVLSFIVSGLENESKVKEMFEDIRISMQEFSYFILLKSYYSAFLTYRKIVEGALWINYLIKNDWPKNDRIDAEKSYSYFLKEFPNLKKYYEESSKLFHAKGKIFFNFFEEDKEIDSLSFFIKLVQKCYEEIEIIYNSIFKIKWISDNEIIERFKILYFRVLKNINLYLGDYEIKSENLYNESYIEYLNLFSLSKNEKMKGKRKYYRNLLIFANNSFELYRDNLEIFDLNFFIENQDLVFLAFDLLEKKVKNFKLNKSVKKIASEKIFEYASINNQLPLNMIEKQERINKNLKYNEIIINELVLIASKIFFIELYKKNSYITQMRLVVEDLIFNITYSKYSFVTINLINELIKKEDKDFSNKKLHKYKHIIHFDRPLYVSSDGKTSGSDREVHNVVFELIESLNYYLLKINKYIPRVFSFDQNICNTNESILLKDSNDINPIRFNKIKV